LIPEEIGFLRYLCAAKVELSEYEFPPNKVSNIQNQLEKLISTNYYLNKSAKNAFRSYLLAYASHSHKDIFNVLELNLYAVGLAFGFQTPPIVDLPISTKRRKRKFNMNSDSKMSHQKFSNSHAFSAINPYGRRELKDKRQFCH